MRSRGRALNPGTLTGIVPTLAEQASVPLLLSPLPPHPHETRGSCKCQAWPSRHGPSQGWEWWGGRESANGRILLLCLSKKIHKELKQILK